jgi:hypothetical protein
MKELGETFIPAVGTQIRRVRRVYSALLGEVIRGVVVVDVLDIVGYCACIDSPCMPTPLEL